MSFHVSHAQFSSAILCSKVFATKIDKKYISIPWLRIKILDNDETNAQNKGNIEL